MAAMVGLILILLILAPFMLDAGTTQSNVDTSQTVIPVFDKQICQPSVNLPSGLDPITHLAMPSWMRLCDWFVEPANPPTIEGPFSP